MIRWIFAILLGCELAYPVPPPPGAEGALTIMPFQTATYVNEPESAALLNQLSEFTTELLAWTDSSTESVVAQARAGNGVLIQHYHAWREVDPAKSRIPVASVVSTVSRAFDALESSRIIRMDLNETITIEQNMPIDVRVGGMVAIPLVVHNSFSKPVDWVLRHKGMEAAVTRVLAESKLAPGQTLGFFVELPVAAFTHAGALEIGINGHSHVVQMKQKQWESAVIDVRILDEAGQPGAARVTLIGADQKAYAPENTMHRMVLGDRHQAAPGVNYFHSSGSFQIELPAGETVIEVIKGMEYQPVRKVITLAANEEQTVEITLPRIAHLQNQGWYSGDVHVHGNLFAQDLIQPADVLAVAQAEDLNVINILPCNDPRTTIISDLQFFTGGPDPVSDAQHIVYYNEEMRNDLYGHVGFLNLKTFVEPAYFGFPHSPFPYDYPGNFPQVEDAKRQRALVTYVHPGLPSEFPVDIALGIADTIDLMSQVDERRSMPLWYALLNCGFRCPASAGTDSFLNIPYHLVPGAGRVYVKVEGEFTYENWIAAFKQGRTFVTNGPLLPLTFNGEDPGTEFRSEHGPYTVRIAGRVDSIVPMDTVEIVVNGEVVRRIPVDKTKSSVTIDEDIEISQSSWVAVRTIAEGHRWVTNDRDTFAHTSPVYVEIGGKPIASKSDAEFYSSQIDVLIAKMHAQGVFENPRQREAIVTRFREGRKVYQEMIQSLDTR